MRLPVVVCVVGARPNFVKIAPILHAFEKAPRPVKTVLIHTGQHYDQSLDHAFFQALKIPKPDENLGVGSGTHAQQTALIMQGFEGALETYQPDAVLVVGDVNSTIACSLVAAKKWIPVIHVEAGLRSFDRHMPEEINRVLTDQLSSIHFITEESARENLLNEGIKEEGIHFVGNVMIDTLQNFIELAIPSSHTFKKYNVKRDNDKSYALLTLHRPSNVDDPKRLRTILATIAEMNEDLDVVFPVHPRTQKKILAANCDALIHSSPFQSLPAIGYLEMLGLLKNARLVLTDSGGVQEETTALGIPCLTLRQNTERPITITQGSNRLVSTHPDELLAAIKTACHQKTQPQVPALWDGAAAQRIVKILVPWLYQTAY